MSQLHDDPSHGSALRIRHDCFDSLGPAVREYRAASGRVLRFVDEGEHDWHPAVVFTGAGTSVRSVRLLEFLRGFREELGVRLISVERNGLGLTPFDPACGPAAHAADVWALLDALEVPEVAVVAISGGGPYAAHLAVAQPERVASIHLACAYSDAEAAAPLAADLDEIRADPAAWWAFPAGSAVQSIPGFADAAVEEATHALLAHGPASTGAGLRHAFELYAREILPALSALRCPSFLYWGTEDTVVPLAHARRWAGALAGATTCRVYAGEGHDVQYRHLDQVLADIRYLGSRTVVTEAGRSALLDATCAAHALDRGATLGLAAWCQRDR